MKRIFILTLVATLALAGCKDFLTEEPLLSNSNEIQLSDFSGLDAAVQGAYSPLASETWYGAKYVLNSDMRGGAARRPVGIGGSRYKQPYHLTYSAESTEYLWSYGYFVISAVNNVLETLANDGADMIGNDVEEQDIKNLKAECLFLRALSHFDMLRLYSKVTAPELGIPVILKTDKTLAEKPARNTVAQVFEQIEKDLEEAAGLMDPDYSRDFLDPTASASLAAIQGLLARVYLYDASWTGSDKYQKAADYATKVIDNDDYRLWTADEYCKVWTKDAYGSGEVIFSVYGDKKNDYDGWWEGPSHVTNPIGYADCSASKDLTDKLDARDVRGSKGVRTKDEGKCMFCTDPDESTGGQLWTMKYAGKGIGDAKNAPDQNNTVVIRLSEMYLIRAEAILNGASISGVTTVSDINKIREKRSLDPSDPLPLLSSVGPKDIANERLFELNFEGHLWFDIARTTRTINYGDAQLRQRLNGVQPDSPLWALPIPIREIDINDNLVQNELE